MRNKSSENWISVEAETPPILPELNDSPTPAEPPLRPLGDIEQERSDDPPLVPNPTGKPEHTPPMSSKELGSVMGTAAKALFDAKLTLEKAHTALVKVRPSSSPSQKDKEIADKSVGYAGAVKKMGETIEALAEEVSAYRDELSGPSNPWLSE